jgi:uncharacterized protein (TIGR00255 family)
LILSGTEKALENLVQMRVVEGETLQIDIESQINFIRKNADIIKVRQPQVLNEYKEKLKERIKVLSDGLELDDSRLLQETAILADRSDISEELTRLDSHLKQFLELTGNSNSPIGRKLEFIVQEINRETNTIGSKSNDFEISQSVIEIKSAQEKIREQLQNIE